MVERTTVRLPDALVAEARRKALAEGRSLTALIEEGLRRVVSDPALARPKRRAPLPVSSEGGGLAPGVGWENLREIDADEDIERMRRF